MTTDLVTVFRGTERSAEQEATAAKNLLLQSGLQATMHDDNTAGIPDGTFEVRVPMDQATEAKTILDGLAAFDTNGPDPSAHHDMVTIGEYQGVTGEIEALGIQSILDANGINAVLIGSSTIPSLAFQVAVPHDRVERARQILAEAQAAGPAAAVEAERESETPS